MRFNSKELSQVAQQESKEFEKEGVLFMKETKDGLFKKTEGISYFVYWKFVVFAVETVICNVNQI